MKAEEILAHVDHTLLKQTATWADIQRICDEAVKYHTATVMVPSAYVPRIVAKYGDALKVATVVGFPNGNCNTAAKIAETAQALADGAQEIDMVINIGMLKAGDLSYVADEIRRLKAAVGDRVLKVIIETCLLTDEEKITMCDLVTRSGADFIKTSTGFSTAGATFDDIALFKAHVGPNVKIKAAGGISSFEDAEKFIALGANRLGTSRIIKLALQEKNA